MREMSKILIVLALVLMGLTGCTNKPGDEDLTKSFNESFEGFKKVGVDLNQYIEASSFEVVDSYQDGKFYVVKAIVNIEVKKDLDKSAIDEIKKKTGMLSAHILQTINMFEILKEYDNGDINEQNMQSSLRTSAFRKPKGSLKSGDEFKGLESEYKFRETDNGWMAVG